MTKSIDYSKLDNFKLKFQHLADMLLKLKLSYPLKINMFIFN